MNPQLLVVPIFALLFATASQVDIRFKQAVQEAESRATYQPTVTKRPAVHAKRNYPPLPPRRPVDLPSRKP